MPETITVGRRNPNAAPPAAAPVLPAHATDEARAERAARLAAAGNRVASEDAAVEGAIALDPFAVLDGGRSPRAVLAAIEPDAPVEAEEDVEAVELRLPNGRTVLYGPVRGKSHALQLGRIFRDTPRAVLAMNTVEYLFNIREIDGKPVEHYVGASGITDLAKAKILLDLIDDDGHSHIQLAHQKFWPVVTEERLQVVKRFFR